MKQFVVVYALLWLNANNILYKEIIINYEEIINWEDEYISISVEDNIGLSLSDYSKHKGYMYKLSQNNIKNDMYVAILHCNKSESTFFSRCIFSNIDRIHNHPVLKLIFVMYNFPNNNTEETKYLIIYSTNRHPQYLND